MRILYAIQGTGNGHICRAGEIVPLLKKNHEVDVLVSGTESEIVLPFDIHFKFHGLSFVFGKNGGIDLLKTYKKSRVRNLLKEINSLDVSVYDLVLNDFEPVSAWACYLKRKPCIALSHQSAVIHPLAPRPNKVDLIGRAILHHYAPSTQAYGFHFEPYDHHIFTPVIRSDVREQPVETLPHYTVYLPSYSDKNIMKMLMHFPQIQWKVFSKHTDKKYRENNVEVVPIEHKGFIESMASCTGVVCGAGFETPAEAIYLQKKLLVIPMKGQYEQQCNAAALKQMGVPVMKSFKKKHLQIFTDWIASSEVITKEYPNHIEQILQDILEKHSVIQLPQQAFKRKEPESAGQFKKWQLKRILKEI